MSSKDALILTILTFITVVLWTFFEAYHTYMTSTIPQSLVIQINPLDPKLPKEVVDKLKNRYNQSSLPSPVSTTSSNVSSPSSNATSSASM